MISSYGRVYNFKTNKILKTGTRNGYGSVELFNNGKSKRINIHRLVGRYFVPGEDDNLVINHIDGNKLNNHDSNLEWCTCGDNNRHAIKTGLNHPGAYQKRKIRIIETGDIFNGVCECANFIKGDYRNVYACLNGLRSTHRGYHFEYV